MSNLKNNLSFSLICLGIFLAVNFFFFFLINYVSIGFKKSISEYFLLPLIYCVMVFILSSFLNKRVLWGGPLIYAIVLLCITFDKNMYALDIAIELSTSLSGLFNVIQHFLQKNEMNNLLTDYIVHIIGLSIYQILILSLGDMLSLKYFKSNLKALSNKL